MFDLLSCLEETPVFSKLAALDHAELVRLARRKQYQKGDYICWQNELWPNAAYIAKGRAEWSILSSGRETAICVSPRPRRCDLGTYNF